MSQTITPEDRRKQFEEVQSIYGNPDGVALVDVQDRIRDDVRFLLKEIERVKQEALARGWDEGYKEGYNDSTDAHLNGTIFVQRPTNPHRNA